MRVLYPAAKIMLKRYSRAWIPVSRIGYVAVTARTGSLLAGVPHNALRNIGGGPIPLSREGSSWKYRFQNTHHVRRTSLQQVVPIGSNFTRAFHAANTWESEVRNS